MCMDSNSSEENLIKGTLHFTSEFVQETSLIEYKPAKYSSFLN